ncbi:MAG: peroxiredoxin family protein [Thainema sp.]
MPILTSTNFEGLVNRRFLKNLLPQPARPVLSLGNSTPDFELFCIQQQQIIRLSQLIQAKRPILLAFTRIFTENQYCPLCFPHIQALNRQYQQFQQLGVDVFMITSTDYDQSTIVVRDLGLKIPLLSDPTCEVFRRYGLGQALGAPLPAQFLLDQTGRLQYAHLFSFLSHNADVDGLLSVAQACCV